MSVLSKHTVGRLANRAKRQAIASVPPVREIAHRRRGRLRRRYASELPAIGLQDEALVSQLRDDAIVITTLGELALPGTAELCAGLERLTALLAARSPAGASTLRPSVDELLEDPGVWGFGMSERMLAIAENYLGMPARYYGADVRREIADGESGGVRQWHRDIEDESTLKILVWLNDVDDDGGPFAYLPVGRSQEAVDRLHYVAGFVGDERLREVVPDDEWRTCPGPRWTAVLADNCRLVHRATPPRARDRYSVTFTWTSRHPVKTMPPEPMTDAQVRRLSAGLSPRQFLTLPTVLQKQAQH